tara:strand:+ start:390 stop:650 length:261 start_codon:yes stop_codon:yes gene_type:complete
MLVKTDHGDFEVKDLTFRDRRYLHGLEVNSTANGEFDMSKFYNVLNWIMEFAFEKPEEKLGKFEDNQIDEILLAIYNQYKEPSKKK